MRTTEIKYGLIIGFGIIAWMLTEYFAGFHTTKLHIGEYSGYFSALIPLVFLFRGVKELRDRSLGGKMSFSQGFIAGFRISFIASVMISLFLLLYIQVIHPDWISLGLEYQRGKMQAEGLSEQEILNNIDLMKNRFSASTMMLAAFLGTLIQGSVLSAIYSAILKRTNPDAD